MKLPSFYFRSFQIMVLAILLSMIMGCSFLPAIVPLEHNENASVSAEVPGAVETVPPPPEIVEGKPVTTSPIEPSEPPKQEQIVNEPKETPNSTAVPVEEPTKPPERGTDEEPLIKEPIIEIENPIKEPEKEPTVEPGKNEQQTNQGVDASMRIAITFDDGPDLKYTPKILDILKEKDVKATFFVVGIQVNKYPEVLQRIETEGHLIGNHSYNHPSFTSLTAEQLEEEIRSTDEKIEAVLGHVPELVRPPYGAINDASRATLDALGKKVVLWNIDPRDWDGTSVKDMMENIMGNAHDGGNILLHSFGSKFVENTVEMLPVLIDQLKEEGYTFVTVDEL